MERTRLVCLAGSSSDILEQVQGLNLNDKFDILLEKRVSAVDERSVLNVMKRYQIMHFCDKESTRVLIAMLVLMSFSGCSDSDSPKTATNDPNLPVDLIASWGNQKEFFINEGFEILEWDVAKLELLKGYYRGGKQYHTGWLTIYMNDGRKYLTKQPRIGVFFEFMKESNLSTKGFGTE